MDALDFSKFTSLQAKALNYYFSVPGPQMVVREVLRFVDDNFKLQGWQGASFQPWAPIKRNGLILVKTGKLRRSFNAEIRANGEVYFFNNLPYARAHNEGFKGQVTVKAHSRNKYGRVKVGNVKSHKVRNIKAVVNTSDVGEFTRDMNLVQRQFAPTASSPSPILDAAIIKEIEKDIKAILTL